MSPSPVTIKWIIRMLYVLWGLSLAAVAVLSLKAGLELPIRFWNADKVWHFIVYLWLAMLPTLLLQDRRWTLRLSVSLVLFGVLLEIGQQYVPGRMFSFADMGANTAGVFLGFYMGNRYRLGLWRFLRCEK